MINMFKRLMLKFEEDIHSNAMKIIWVVTSLAIIALMVFPALLPNEKNRLSKEIFPEIGAAKIGHLPNMTEEAIKEQMQKDADKSNFAFKINARPVFANGESKGNLRIENPGHNLYPFVVKIFLNETSEEIYNSGGMLPNHHIDEDRLVRILPKGEYAATAYIYAFDPVTNEYGGKSAVGLTLIINS